MAQTTKVVNLVLAFLLCGSLLSISTARAQGGSPGETPGPNLQTADNTIYLPIVSRSGSSVTPPGGRIVVDHTSVRLFSQIPENYLTAARNLRVLFSDRSVGENIDWYLDCLTANTWAEAPNPCRIDYYNSNWDYRSYSQPDLNSGLVPLRIQFTPSPVRYNRSNWTFEFRGGSWSDLTQDFIQSLAPAYLNSKDVLTYQFSYLNVGEGNDIADPNRGFFANNPDKYDIYDLEAFMAQHPNKTYIFWTTSLARSIGTQEATDFNNRMRQYTTENNAILFDVADIESHTDTGVSCYDNRDGVSFCGSNGCENLPNDHINLPAICQDYTTEWDGGHLGAVSSGGIQIAKAFWVLMARIAGWNP